ncbi:peptidase domain-containing ABC transporter [Clostridium boliviensis]|uniref:Peptidase domain-containing ABC transporter n=1 Tax=Clostridium boliviensis TaxID=318465 RepID=A0ABU4GJF6_9CLOT|nr:peptidase domain-containing ABC transporter [Clostridium boliviensis]MDW2797739.1 peptidase domain-containing ABC transporter [Clostridium boliviensis]
MPKKKKVPLIRQLGTTDCGISCLTMIFQYYGCKFNQNDIRANLNIGRDGLSLSDMKYIAEEYGFQFTAYEDFLVEENISDNLPLIMCTKNNHYFVVTQKKKNKYVINDPVNGLRHMSFQDLLNECERYIIKIIPTKDIRKKSKHVISSSIKIKYSSVVFAFILTLLTQCIVLLPSLTIQKIVDKMGEGPGVYKTLIYFGIAFFIMIAFFCANLLKQNIILLVQNSLYKETIHYMIDKLFHINLKFYESHSSGDLQYRFNSVNDIYDFVSSLLISTIVEIITGIICAIFMIGQSFVLFLMTLIIILLQLIYISLIKKKLDELVMNYMAERSKLEGKMVDTLVNIQQIRCMRLSEILNTGLKHDYDKVINLLRRKSIAGNFLESGINAIGIITPLLIYICGSYFVSLTEMTIGGLIAFVTLSSYFMAPFNTVSIVIPQLGNLKETLLRMEEFLTYNENAVNGQISIPHFEHLKLKELSFSYGNSNKKELSDINFELRAGERIAIVGTSGSGKSTLLKIIMNVLFNYAGKITLNGIDIIQINRDDIDRIFTIVTQTPVAFSGSIRDNIDVLNTLSDDKLNKAVRVSETQDFIQSCPMGINTFIGENGQNISGGQKQRIAIARAVALEPEVIVFDEATSNLDTITEKKIYENIKNEGVSQIVVTHRLNTIQDFDRIYVIESGKIIESGKHEELLSNKSLYYRLINSKP